MKCAIGAIVWNFGAFLLRKQSLWGKDDREGDRGNGYGALIDTSGFTTNVYPFKTVLSAGAAAVPAGPFLSVVIWTRCLSLHSLEKLSPKWLKSSRWGASVLTWHSTFTLIATAREVKTDKNGVCLRLALSALMRRGKTTTNLLFTLLQVSCFRSKWVKCRSSIRNVESL